jgi:predicted transcriptional regulator
MTNKDLPKPAKIAGTKALTELGYSVRKIAELMGINKDTVMAYQGEEMTEQIRQFSDTIKKIYLEQDFELAQLALRGIKEKIGGAEFRDLVGLLKIVRELQEPKGLAVATQVNIELPSWAKE